jgi:large subunit ribosomal protein L28
VSRTCQLSAKRRNKSNKICFSNKKHRYFQQANIQTKRVWDPETNRFVVLRVSVKALKTITRYGLRAAIKRYGGTVEAMVASL